MREIFSEFPKALKVYHNDGGVKHLLPRLFEMGFDVFNSGIELQKILQKNGMSMQKKMQQ